MRGRRRSAAPAARGPAWHPDWCATDNGRPIQLRRVNHNFVGVPVEPGDHTLRIWYRPWDFYLGVLVSLVTLSTILVVTTLHLACYRRQTAI